jgi:hypothetical protein
MNLLRRCITRASNQLRGRPVHSVACYDGGGWFTVRTLVPVARMVIRASNPSRRSFYHVLIHISATLIAVWARITAAEHRRRAHGTWDLLQCTVPWECLFRARDRAIWGSFLFSFRSTTDQTDHSKIVAHHTNFNFVIEFLFIPTLDQAQFSSQINLTPVSV